MTLGINKVILVGSVGKEPENKILQKGGSLTRISLATSETVYQKEGGKRIDTEWHNVTFFGKLAEIASKYITKGSKIYIEGKLKTSKWQDKETGKDRYQTSILGEKLQLLSNEPSPTHKQKVEEVSPEDEWGDLPF